LNIDNNGLKDNDESSRDDEEIVNESDAKCSDPDEETISQRRDEEEGRPALLKTGRLDRPWLISLEKHRIRTQNLRMRSRREMILSCD